MEKRLAYIKNYKLDDYVFSNGDIVVYHAQDYKENILILSIKGSPLSKAKLYTILSLRTMKICNVFLSKHDLVFIK